MFWKKTRQYAQKFLQPEFPRRACYQSRLENINTCKSDIPNVSFSLVRCPTKNTSHRQRSLSSNTPHLGPDSWSWERSSCAAAWSRRGLPRGYDNLFSLQENLFYFILPWPGCTPGSVSTSHLRGIIFSRCVTMIVYELVGTDCQRNVSNSVTKWALYLGLLLSQSQKKTDLSVMPRLVIF